MSELRHGQAIALAGTGNEVAVIGDFDSYGFMAVAKDRREYLVTKEAIMTLASHRCLAAADPPAAIL